MAINISPNAKFNVAIVETQALYDAIVGKVASTAYFVVESKKIYVDGVAYGFNETDITMLMVLRYLGFASTDSIDMSLSIVDNKVVFNADIRLVPSANRYWSLTDEETYNAGSTKVTATTSSPYIKTSNFLDSLEGQYPAAGRTVGDVARGEWDVTPEPSQPLYFYAIVMGNSTTETNLIKLSTDGLYILESDIQALIDDSIEKDVDSRVGNPTGCYIDGVYNGTHTTEGACTTAGGVWKTGIASIGTDGKIPSGQLPSYVDDVIEVYIRSSQVEFSPVWFSLISISGAALTPESGKIYSVIGVPSGSELYLNATFRWGGSAYVNISNPNLKTIDNNSLYGTGNLSIGTYWEVVES